MKENANIFIFWEKKIISQYSTRIICVWMPEKTMILPDMIGRKGLEVSLACPLSFIVFIWGQ